jgi:hypothetical protein
VQKVLAGLPVGVYDLSVRQGDQLLATLSDAFTVVDNQTVNDLLSDVSFLWSDPTAPRVGDQVQIGLIVQRLGGAAVINLAQVLFWIQEADQSQVELGSGNVPALGVNDSAITAAVTWAPAAQWRLYVDGYYRPC